MKTPTIAFALITAVALSGYAFAESQPLTRAGCDEAGMTWNDNANVCGVAVMAEDESSSQPLTRADCDAAGMTWNDNANACGVSAAAAAPAKKMMAPGEKKAVKKAKTRHGAKKTVKKKSAHGTTAKKEKHPILDWLKRSRNQS
jgi:hypothetical protein